MGETLKINLCDFDGRVWDTITIDTETSRDSDSTSFLKLSLINDFMEVIQSSPIFMKSEKLKEKYNLICAVMHRLTSAVNYLNNHDKFPESEEDFIFFLVYACMLRDAISKLYKDIYQKNLSCADEKKYFKDVKNYETNVFTDDVCPTDDIFFEYLRSMAFAHPYDTDDRKRPFFESKEKQYCPWVIVSGNQVGIRVYTSSTKFIIQDLTFPFETLKEYIKDRFESLSILKKWAEDEISSQNQEWLNNKVKRSEDVMETIKSIREIYAERFLETYDIDCIERYLKCQNTKPQNEENVSRFKEALVASVKKICDALDTLDEDALDEATGILNITPEKSYPSLSYHLEKIFCYLDDDHGEDDVAWGLEQAKAFSNKFAKKWVTIDTQTMSFDEIKLLVRTACYLEAINEHS